MLALSLIQSKAATKIIDYTTAALDGKTYMIWFKLILSSPTEHHSRRSSSLTVLWLSSPPYHLDKASARPLPLPGICWTWRLYPEMGPRNDQSWANKRRPCCRNEWRQLCRSACVSTDWVLCIRWSFRDEQWCMVWGGLQASPEGGHIPKSPCSAHAC